MVRGWWPGIVLSYLPPKPKRAFRAILSFAVVWGWWSAIVLSFAVARGWSLATKNKFHSLKHRDNTQIENTDKKHTERKHRERKHTERKHTDKKKTQIENTDRKHTERKHRERKHTERKHTDKKHADRKHRQKTERKHREKKHTEKTLRKHKASKTSVSTRLHRNFTEQASKTSVSCMASSKFHRTTKTNVSCEAASKFLRQSFQNERFVRGVLQISQNKLPKRTFRARLPRNFKEQASKTSVSCEASSNFHRTSFKNERFARDFLQISQNKLPKRAFRARLPRNFKEQASKTSVSCEASSNFHRTSFKNERFARDFLQISQNKLPKRAFCASLPQIFIEQSFQNERFARSLRQFQKKICVSPQFRAIDPPNPTRGFIQQKQNVRLATTACHPHLQNVRFTITAACTKMYEFNA